MDLNNPDILSRVASKKKPIILSTGFSSILEIHEAIETIKKINFSAKIYLLHCVSAYPPKNKNLNLKNIIMLKNTFNLEVGIFRSHHWSWGMFGVYCLRCHSYRKAFYIK